MSNEVEELHLDEDLRDLLEEEIEQAIEKVANQKDWESFGLELLVVLMEMAAQCAVHLNLNKEEFLDFAKQFLENEEGDGSSRDQYNYKK